MSIQNSLFKSVASLLKPAPSASLNVEPQDSEALFRASIAHLSPDEQYKRIQTREMYRRMAQRQGIMEIEQHSVQFNQTGQHELKLW